MNSQKQKNSAGFSLIELVISMTITLVAMAILSSIMQQGFGIRSRESQKTDALTSAQAALNVISREIANSGFGMYEDATSKIAYNGIVTAESDVHRIRIRANLDNAGGIPSAPGASSLVINAPGEDVTYFFDSATSSIVRYDPNGGGTGVPRTAVVVNRISNVTFKYYDYAGSTSAATGPLTNPTKDTGRVQITVDVTLDPVPGQPNNQQVRLISDVTLRNNGYMLQQY
jgi:type II secretory pathway pseudopilin PulG